MEQARTPYPSDCSDAEWALAARFLTLMDPAAPQRKHALRESFNALRWMVANGAKWRSLPHDFPPWKAVHEQAMRWSYWGCFEALAHALRARQRVALERNPQPSACVLDGRTLQSTPESGARAGYDGYKRRKGSKVHIAVDTVGNLLAATVTPANEQERDQVAPLLEQAQAAAAGGLKQAWADQGYTGAAPAAAACAAGVDLEVVKPPAAKKGFQLLPRRWVVERTYGWLGRARRLARDYERLASTLAAYHWVAASTLLLKNVILSG